MRSEYSEENAAAAAAEVIRRNLPRSGTPPRVALVSGSGLGVLATLGTPLGALSYDRIPGLGAAGVAGHENRWLLAEAAGRPFYCLLGRRHLYEGIAPETAGLAMRVLARLGVRRVILTNAAGGLGPRLHPGDLMLIRDHVNLMKDDCGLRIADCGIAECGMRNAECGMEISNDFINPQSAIRNPQFYDSGLCEGLLRCALEQGIALKEGVYAALSGPSYETRAEAAMLRRMGADAVGMSTVPEVLAAARAGMRVAAVSLITNSHWWRGGPASHAEVLETAAASGRTLARLLGRVIESIDLDCS